MIADEMTQPKGRKTDRTTAVDRQVAALTMRKEGMTYAAIASRLGYAAPSSAMRAVRTGVRLTLQEPADALIELELARLDALHASLWDRALAGDLAAIDRVLGVMKRRAKLLGLDDRSFMTPPIKKAATLHRYAEAVAVRYGLDPAEVLAEAEQILAEVEGAW